MPEIMNLEARPGRIAQAPVNGRTAYPVGGKTTDGPLTPRRGGCVHHLPIGLCLRRATLYPSELVTDWWLLLDSNPSLVRYELTALSY